MNFDQAMREVEAEDVRGYFDVALCVGNKITQCVLPLPVYDMEGNHIGHAVALKFDGKHTIATVRRKQ
jgi:hypothetical protein